MHALISRASSDEAGFDVFAELVLIASIGVLALIVGLSEVASGPHQKPEQVRARIEIVPPPYDFSRLCDRDNSRSGKLVMC